jgi:hypothetical protein
MDMKNVPTFSSSPLSILKHIIRSIGKNKQKYYIIYKLINFVWCKQAVLITADISFKITPKDGTSHNSV